MNIVLDEAKDLVGNTNTAILETELQKYFFILQCPFRQVPDNHEQCGCDIRIKMDLVLTAPPCNISQNLGLQAFHYELFGEDNTFEMSDICSEYVNIGGYAHIFSLRINFPCGLRLLFCFNWKLKVPGLRLQQLCTERHFIWPEEQSRVYVRDHPNFNRNRIQKCFYPFNMLKQTVHFWKRSKDLNRMFFNVKFYIQELYG